jgi:hypothetical protein
MRRAQPGLVARMLIYRGLIMREHPGAVISQYVIVLGEGRVRGHQDLAGQGFALDLGLVYLRDRDPEGLLTDLTLAPLAVLGRGGPARRAAVFAQALRLIREHGGSRTPELLEFALVMATIRLTPPTIADR